MLDNADLGKKGGERKTKYKIVTILLIIALISGALPLFNVQVIVKANPAVIHVPADWPTISLAIAHAISGDTILVSDGTYNEAVDINIPLTITSVNGPAVTIIDGAGIALASAGLVKITAAGDVTFNGFTVENATLDAGLNEFEIFFSGPLGTYTITNNRIVGIGDANSSDFEVGFYSQNDAANVVFKYNTITDIGGNNIVFECHTGTTEISHNTLEAGVGLAADSIFFMTYDGINVDALQNVSYNTFNMGTGTVFDYTHRSSAISFSTPGVAYGHGDAQFTNVLIQGNTINNLKSYRRGIGFWNGGGGGGGIIGPDVEDNTITGTSTNESYGIDFIATGSSPIAASYATVLNNVISNTAYGIYLRTDGCAPDAQIYYNNIAGNTVGLDNTVGSSAVDARYNWWGSSTGPYNATSNPSGIGNPVNGNADYQPYQTNPVPTTFSLAVYSTAIIKAADRLVALQSSTDYGWDWIVDGEPPWAGTSATNLYGVTALGLVDAYMATGNSTYLTAAENTANFMMYGNPSNGDFYDGHGSYSWGYSSDYKFLMQLSTVTGNASIVNYALAAWAWQKANRSQYYGNGNQSALWNSFVNEWVGPGYYGLGAWQASDFGLAAWEMGDLSWAQGMATVINASIPDILASYATNYSIDYIDMGMAWALKLLVTVDPVTYAPGVATLETQLLNNQLCDGSWDFGSNTGESQTTAYAVMGLLTAGEYAAARKGTDWLAATQLPNGGWEGSPDEYSEIDSEAMQALTFSIVQLTVASAHDSPTPSIGTTSYLVGTTVTANVTSPVPDDPYHQYVCTGWTGTGNVPAFGTGTSVTFTIDQDSNITWNWMTHVFPPLLEIVPSLHIAKDLNQTFTMNITLSNVTSDMQLVGFDFRLSYNSTMLNILSVDNGTFLEGFAGPPDRGVLYYGPYYYASPDYVEFAGLIIPAANGTWDPNYPTGNGTIATITFQVIYQPYGLENPTANCSLTFLMHELGAPGGIPIPNVVQGGSYGIVPTPIGDINFDGVVDIYDAILFAGSFGATPSSPNWNPYCDLNHDHIIDIYDAILLAAHFGEVRPDP